MTRSDSTKLPQENSISRRELFTFGIGATVFMPDAFLWKNASLRLLNPPPIIIKSGSFIIDSIDGFKDAGNVTGNAKRKKFNQYKGSFVLIRSVFVNQINEITPGTATSKRPEGYFHQDARGLIIQIWFQKLLSENLEVWDPNDITGLADVENRPVSPLTLELPDDLSKSNSNKHHKRKNKDRLDFKKDAGGKDRYFRIGRIQIIDPDKKVLSNITSIDGDEYLISLWDTV
jgi:hypothetical protein